MGRGDLRQLYDLVNRLRASAKDVQNYTDRALNASHVFFPMIEKAYPCGGADAARQQAHALHMWVGRTKDAIGIPLPLSAKPKPAKEGADIDTFMDGSAEVKPLWSRSCRHVERHGTHFGGSRWLL